MGRWIAIGRKREWEDANAFTADLSQVNTWRPDARTTITTVTALADGRLLAECHAPKLENFQAWLSANGWEVESCTPLSRLARMGNIWTL